MKLQRPGAIIGLVPFKVRSLSLNLPFGLGGVTIDVTEAEARAAWALYVEYSTRIAGSALEDGLGSPREALDSLRTLFASTREVLRGAGPEVAQHPDALGPLAIRALNVGVRPFLVRWHTTLGPEPAAELDGEERARFDLELSALREGLGAYVEDLGQIAGIGRAG